MTDIQSFMINSTGSAAVENDLIFIIKYLVTFTLKLNSNFNQIIGDWPIGYGAGDLTVTIATHIGARENHETARISLRQVGATGWNSAGREGSDTITADSKT